MTLPSSHSGHPSMPVVTPPAGLEGMLEISERAEAVVVFAHGSGSSRNSPRNRQVAAALRQTGLAMLLGGLLTEEEAADRRKVFDIGLLARRQEAAVHCVTGHAATKGKPVGLFGANTGAAAALVVAAEQPATAGAVVSRGGRPDLAGEMHLKNVAVPTLLIVGGEDRQVLDLNDWARSWMTCPTELAIVPGATHLFKEPGTLEQVAQLAAGWFRRWLVTEARHAPV